jgi:hypothetical protein
MSFLSLPDQTIAENKKTKEWHIDHAISYATYSITDNYNDQRQEMLKLFRAYNAELSDEEAKLAKAITCPHGTYLGIPYTVYPLIQSKIEQIVGEFIQRPLRRKAYVTDKKSKNKKFDEKLKMLSEQIMREITEKQKDNLGFTPDTQNPDMEIPEDVEEFFEKDFKPAAEEIADSILNIFLDVRKEKHKFKQLFTDYGITDRAHVVFDKEHGFTTIRKVHPLDCDYDINPYKVVQDNHDYFFENYYLTENEIYNTFPELTRSDKEKIKEAFTAISDTDSTTYESQELGNSSKYNGWFQTSNKVHRLRLINAMWKSRKRISIKVNKNKEDREFYKKVDSNYEERKNDKLEHIDGEMPRHVIMLGPYVALSWGLMDKRYSHIDDPYSCQLPVLSIVRDNTVGTSLIKSVAAKLYQLQQMASEVLFEIRLALKSAGDSRVLVYDAAQTPKEFSKGAYESGLNRVMHHIKKDKLMIINSKQKGMNSSFNQFTSLDLSQKGGIQDLFNGLAIIEDLASKFVGISPEREGEIGQYQTATGVDKAIRGSAARTEVLFTPFDEFIQALLEKVILKAKHDYEKGEVIHYIFGEMKTKFLVLMEDFFLADFGIYLSDARKDKEAADRIDRAAEMALSNSNTPEMVMGLIEVFEGESAVEKKQVFKRMLDSMNEMRQEQEKAASEQAQAQLQADAQNKDKDRDVQYAGHEKDEKVAKIYVQGKGMDRALDNKSKELIKSAELAEKRNENNKEKQN